MIKVLTATLLIASYGIAQANDLDNFNGQFQQQRQEVQIMQQERRIENIEYQQRYQESDRYNPAYPANDPYSGHNGGGLRNGL